MSSQPEAREAVPTETLQTQGGHIPGRWLALVSLTVLLAGLATAYLWKVRAALPVAPAAEQISLHQVVPGTLLFVNKSLNAHGVVGARRLDASDRDISSLRCERVHFADGRGVCLVANRGVLTTYWAVFFGADLQTTQRLPLPGIPSRTRVAPGGEVAATTVFVSGHSYAAGKFSTETSIWRSADGSRIATLDQFEITRDGKPFKAVDFNFWGVTFAKDGNRFFATLATGGTPYLIEGDLKEKKARVLLSNVECPSLSPDNRKVAFKRLRQHGGWALHVLDLDGMSVTALSAEVRNVDDQVEWLNGSEILYALSDSPDSATPGENIWALSLDGKPPRVHLARATSPARIP